MPDPALQAAGKYRSVKKSDPYAFCRNPDCEAHGDIREKGHTPPEATEKGQHAETQQGGKKQTKPKGKVKLKSKRQEAAKEAAEAAKEVQEAVDKALQAVEKRPRPLCEVCGRVECVCDQIPANEPEAVTKARGRIRRALQQNGNYTHNIIGLVLTMLAQELGNKDIANQLIDEYQLTKRFGILKSEQS
jgi:hypothetical protein